MELALPKVFECRMKELLGDEWPAFYESYGENRFWALRFNTLKTDLTKEKKEWIKDIFGITTEVAWAWDAFYYNDPQKPGKHPFHEIGTYYIQEPSAMSAAVVLDVKPGMRVLDLCAAPGGKSTQIASMLQGKGLLVTNEIHPARCKILSQNIERMGVTNSIVTNEDSRNLAAHFGCFFHAVLVDAPCSGEGMFRKNPEAVEEWSEGNVRLCAQRQREILDNAAEMLLPGGKMVYSTCTFSPEENEQTIVDFLNKHEEFEILEISGEQFSDGRAEWAGTDHSISQDIQKAISKTKRLWPHKLNGEGHYVALLGKKGKLPDYQGNSGTDLSWNFSSTGKREKSKEKKRGKKRNKKEKNNQDFSFVEDFLSSILDMKLVDWIRAGKLEQFGNQLYRMPDEEVRINGIHVVRAGLHIGEFKKNRFEPSHALALAVRKDQVNNSVDISVKDERTYAYFRGETFFLDETEMKSNALIKKDWVLVCIEGMAAGWGKLAGNQLKNHYPKGLRKEM